LLSNINLIIYHQEKGPLKLFYGLYPIVLESLLGRLLAFYVFPFFGISVYNEASIGGYDLLIELLVFPPSFFLLNSLLFHYFKALCFLT